MKKALSIILALCMLLAVLSLAGCSKEASDTPSDGTNQEGGTQSTSPDGTDPGTVPDDGTTEGGQDETPNDPYGVKAQIANGEHPLVALSIQNAGDQTNLVLIEAFTELIEGAGFEFMVSDYQAKLDIQITQLENFITMEPCAILINVMDAGGIQKVVEDAMAAGIVCATMSIKIDDYTVSGGSVLDWSVFGQNLAQMASAYIDYKWPDAGDGEIKTAVETNYNNVNPSILWDACLPALESDSRIDIVYTESGLSGLDVGYNFAESALTYDPEIRLFLVDKDLTAIGASNYIISLSGADPSEYCVLCYFGSKDSFAVIDQSQEDLAVFRGTVTTDVTKTAGAVWQSCYEVLMGEAEVPNYVPESLLSYNHFGFEL